ncbi:hypothetical protein B0H14DRAFT_2576270 [Mycena olivaceomarginata]|nr:hypothetical protein B0H14DRAFT_2576270 [Mycena olivaceomarginata]
MNNPPTQTLIRQLKLTSWQEGLSRRSRLYGLGLEGLASCDLCFGSGGLRSRGHRGRGLASCDSFLGSGGLRLWTEAASSVWASGGIGVVAWQAVTLFWFWGLEVVAWQAATSVWGASGSWPGKLRLLFGHQGASGSSPGKLRPLFGFWGLDVVAWQAATSVWVLGEQIEIWPGQSQLLSGQSRMLWPDCSRTTWPVVLPLSWLHRRKKSAKLFA